jgi:hypothetical protein
MTGGQFIARDLESQAERKNELAGWLACSLQRRDWLCGRLCVAYACHYSAGRID